MTTSENARELLRRLEKCRVNFDPTVDHSNPATKAHKIAFVPVDVFEALKTLLKSL